MDKHIIGENRRETLALIKHRRTPKMEFAGSKGIDKVQ